MEVQLQENSPVILVDGGYFMFHRFFATLKWYKYRNPDVDEGTCMGIEEFCAAVQKHTMDSITKMRKMAASVITGKKRITRKDWDSIPLWFALDCRRAEVWRNQITDGYKGTRDSNRQPLDPSCFGTICNIIRGEVPVLESASLEADDIIAITHRRLRDLGHKGTILCITNDSDYLQLLDGNTLLYNLESKNLSTRSCGNPKKDLLLKVLLGDKSDNIPPVRSNLQEKRLKSMEEDEIMLSLCLTEEEMTRMEKNRALIDFARIPKSLADDYLASHSIHLTKN